MTAAAKVQGQPRAPGEASVKQVFTLDKTKVPNMAKLFEVVTVKGQSLAQIVGVDSQPNIVSFAGQLLAPAGNIKTSYAERACILVKL